MRQDKTQNVLISSRVRLARNISGFLFPNAEKDAEKGKGISKAVFKAASRVMPLEFIQIKDLSDTDAEWYKEAYIVSSDLAKNTDTGAVLINSDQKISIMLNEEDHIRAQCFSDNFDMPAQYAKIAAIDDAIAKELKVAFDDNLGYLTACPTNIGTGLRASAMLFLPALTLSGLIQPMIRNIKSAGLTVRGMYGEGSEAEGDMYQISNALTLGVSESYIISRVQEYILSLCEAEKEQREELYEDNRVALRDKCQRSLGILLHAYTLSTKEYYELISDVKLGVCLGILPIVSISKIDDLTTRIKPAHIIKYSGRDLDAGERDIARANFVSHTLNNLIKSGGRP